MRLAKVKRNGMVEAVLAGGLDATSCTFDFEDGGGRITHAPSESSFVLEGDDKSYTTTAVVAAGAPWPPAESFTWSEARDRVQRWAREVQDDIDTPDLWAELQRAQETLASARYEDVENTAFTVGEQDEIAEQIGQIREYVESTYSLSETQEQGLAAKFADIEAAAGRIGRKDWHLALYGTMFTVIVAGLLPPEGVQHVMALVLNGLDHLFGGERPAELPPAPDS